MSEKQADVSGIDRYSVSAVSVLSLQMFANVEAEILEMARKSG